MTPLAVVTWKWGTLFGPEYVNRLFDGVARHFDGEFAPFCITDDPRGLDAGINVLPLPTEFRDTPRCCRRVWLYSADRVREFGARILHLDLDTVVTGNVTGLFSRPEPLVLLRMDYAEVYSPAMCLMDTGVLHEFYEVVASDLEGFRQATGERHASDLAMLNFYLAGRTVPSWGRTDGVTLYFGEGYERHAHLGIGPKDQTVPDGTRVVVLGSADLPVIRQRPPRWWTEHWA